ncbi:MAG: SpoIIE family protein phosphatase [Gemmataceae bacterium]
MRFDTFLDIHHNHINKHGEELCGDTVRAIKTEAKTVAVLSDGLGSGVKANILATLTAEIVLRMLLEDVPLKDVIETVIGTLPVCQVRKLAYSTFTVIQVRHEDNSFEVINCDNPPVVYFRRGRRADLPNQTESILGKKIIFARGRLEIGDLIGVISDGVLYAGLGKTMNFGWGWDNVANFLEQHFQLHGFGARTLVRAVMAETNRLYGHVPGDDATVLGLHLRRRNSTIIFTGPPLDPATDEMYVERLLSFNGRRVVCGGTTANIVGDYLGELVRIDMSTLHPEVPPIGYLSEVDLVTEGILTMAKALELLRSSDGVRLGLQDQARTGAHRLAEEILDSDFLYFLVGQKMNEVHQNPLLPRTISIRRSLVEEMAEFLRRQNKEVLIEYC